ncbi:unnamed protein product [Urochloa humidicola]
MPTHTRNTTINNDVDLHAENSGVGMPTADADDAQSWSAAKQTPKAPRGRRSVPRLSLQASPCVALVDLLPACRSWPPAAVLGDAESGVRGERKRCASAAAATDWG